MNNKQWKHPYSTPLSGCISAHCVCCVRARLCGYGPLRTTPPFNVLNTGTRTWENNLSIQCLVNPLPNHGGFKCFKPNELRDTAEAADRLHTPTVTTMEVSAMHNLCPHRSPFMHIEQLNSCSNAPFAYLHTPTICTNQGIF